MEKMEKKECVMEYMKYMIFEVFKYQTLQWTEWLISSQIHVKRHVSEIDSWGDLQGNNKDTVKGAWFGRQVEARKSIQCTNI